MGPPWVSIPDELSDDLRSYICLAVITWKTLSEIANLNPNSHRARRDDDDGGDDDYDDDSVFLRQCF